MSKSLLSFLALVFFFKLAVAQTPGSGTTIPLNQEDGEIDDHSPVNIPLDTVLHISNRNIPYDSVLAWKHDEKFGYINQLDSLLKNENSQQLKNRGGVFKKSNQKSDRFGADPSNDGKFSLSPVAKYILWAIAALLVLFVLYNIYILKGKFGSKKLANKVKWVEGEMAVEGSIVNPGGYSKLISDAVANNNFRLAIRYQFLFLLLKLEVKGFLHLSKDKTNSRYIREINPEHQTLFSGLVQIYERAWYGHHPVSASQYNEIARQFNQFNP